MDNIFTHNGYKVTLKPDHDAQAPENDEPDMFIVTTRNRSCEILHNKLDAACAEETFSTKDYWVFPLYAYVHSGVALSLSSFSCPWDSGQIGLVFAEKSSFKYRTRAIKRASSAFDAAKSYVESWNQYLNGDVWGYVIETPDGDHIDSCWGFYGMDYAKSEAIVACLIEPAPVGGIAEDIAFEETLA